jgi:hypothetical protein
VPEFDSDAYYELKLDLIPSAVKTKAVINPEETKQVNEFPHGFSKQKIIAGENNSHL